MYKGVKTLGYREYAKDFEIEYVDRPGRKRPKAVRIYVGPHFQLKVSPDRIRWLQRFYLAGLLACGVFLLIPMCIDCGFTRTWYIQSFCLCSRSEGTAPGHLPSGILPGRRQRNADL